MDGIADLDIIMDHCAFSANKYVKDCLEFMRIGTGLDGEKRVRRTKLDQYNFIYVEADSSTIDTASSRSDMLPTTARLHPSYPDGKLSFNRQGIFEPPLINPGPAASAPNPTALRDMFDDLKNSPWAAPFLHPRFADLIKFKLWNTTEQLDAVTELKDDWRAYKDNPFNSVGHVYNVKLQAPSSNSSSQHDDPAERVGSDSEKNYDKMSTILSDLVRFVLCHRFGGIYLDADIILLRDWEELWGWRGAFAYRWSYHIEYNTAVLRLNRGSALGTFLFRTALQNNFDFHPMTVWRYMRDAQLQGLLLQLPDALFDSAWLNWEGYQKDRPPFPLFTDFKQFFKTARADSAAPDMLGFEGFFRGAYAYHYHNCWWMSFDPARNYPDLGPRFAAGETRAKEQMYKQLLNQRQEKGKVKLNWVVKDDDLDEEDLSWATVLKRTFEAYIRGERPNMYGEMIQW
ncbi:hypothetical protein FRC07_004842 [Ceratobasidium sp. 392]|nr:hypothetical protein FRC07_004842 [Ceratobasidium sp. 392]